MNADSINCEHELIIKLSNTLKFAVYFGVPGSPILCYFYREWVQEEILIISGQTQCYIA
jgi:hypothetical protein